MAKSDSFFIRARATTNGASFITSEIDLGSFVNLGVSKSTLLRVHNISIQYADESGADKPVYAMTNTPAKIGWQLTTQSQTDLVFADDKSLVSSGALQLWGDPNATAHALGATETIDMNPQTWRNGYLVGVDNLYFSIDTVGTVGSGEACVSIVIECTLETATQASATALALSQQ